MKHLTISLFFVTATLLNAAIAVDSTSSGFGTKSSGATGITLSQTVGAGAVLYVVIAGVGNVNTAKKLPNGLYFPGSVTSVTYGGVALTKVADCGGYICQIWRLTNPPPGTANIVTSWPAIDVGWARLDVAGISLSGVDPTTPENATATVPNAITTNITTTVPNTLVIGVVTNDSGGGGGLGGYTTLFNNVGSVVVYSGYLPVAATGVFNFATGIGGGTPAGIAVVAVNPYTGTVPTSAAIPVKRRVAK
jgi:hypothetical protein